MDHKMACPRCRCDLFRVVMEEMGTEIRITVTCSGCGKFERNFKIR